MSTKGLSKKRFELESEYSAAGDQPKVISDIVGSLQQNNTEQTILGVTGSGKTFMMASIVQELQRPTLVIAHNKTLAAQLAEEFRQFFPNNAVHYFVSYYDYYQPESYIPRSDTYIEKETQINDEIDRLRNASTQALLTRRDVLIVASVSCIYGLGNPEDMNALKIELTAGEEYKVDKLIRRLIDLQYTRTDLDLKRGYFRLRGDTLEIWPASEERGYRFSFFGNTLESIEIFETVTRTTLEKLSDYTIFPARQFVTTQDKMTDAVSQIEQDMEAQIKRFSEEGKILQAERIKQRTQNDIDMMKNIGYVNGIENYSRYFDGRAPGEPPTTLLDYFPADFLCFVDESHITLPQIGGMYAGDRSRKTTLVEYGFRLPSAMDNRPLTRDEFHGKMNQLVYVSATPGEYEFSHSAVVSQAIIRPTGLLDPEIILKPTLTQVDDVMERVRERVSKGQRVLITTLTKKFAEELDLYFKQLNIRSAYIHSDVDTIERIDIIRDLRTGVYDVLIGINLLREGLDLPEVSLVAIFDADKEGFLRSKTSLIQIVGRAARHEEGQVIMYADNITDSMKYAMSETERRRGIQMEYNRVHGITPKSTSRKIQTIADDLRKDMEKDEDWGEAGAHYSPMGFLEKTPAVAEEVTQYNVDPFSDFEIAPNTGKYSKRAKNKAARAAANSQPNKNFSTRGQQLFSNFEAKKQDILTKLRAEDLALEDLRDRLQIAIDAMDFEMAAAIRELMQELEGRK
ncbi:MAG: excinuclease ABC subunit UvrB [Patescibacteria group bacterium]